MARHRAPPVRLELGEGHLDGVQVGAVWGQEQEPGAMVLEDAGGLGALVDGQVIEDHDVAPGQGRGELGFDPQVEGGAIHRLVDDPWRAEPVAAQAGDERLRVPVAERGGAGQPGAASGAAAQPDHLGGDGGLVHEHEPRRLVTHSPLPRAPAPARLGHVGACALGRHQGFFCT